MPIAPGDTAALAQLVAGDAAFAQMSDLILAEAVARAVCPVGFSVIADDDLRAVLDEFGWREMHYATADDFQAIYDRLRGKVDGV
jgi:hypothetical protein